MRTYAIALLLSFCLSAQTPGGDARNKDLPHTDTHFKMPVYRNLAEWEARKTHLRDQILFASGLYPLPSKTPLNPQISGRIENGDYSIEKVALETLPGYYLGGNLYRPLGRTGKLPAIASPHGHWTYGRLAHDEFVSVPGRAINLARQGYVVFTYDMVGYTDTVQTPHIFGTPREQLWGFGPLGLQLWNSIRVIDFLSWIDGVDPARIGATGASGGATQTFLLAAVDERVRYSVPVNMISAIMQGGSPCENAPGLRIGTSNLEIGAMMAPRPMLMVSATGDWTKNTPREEFPALHGIYELYAKASNVETVQIDSPHNYNKASREAMYRFFGKHMLGSGQPADAAERSIRLEKLQDMLVWHGKSLPPKALTYDQIRDQWVQSARQQNEAALDPAELRKRFQLALKAEWPERVFVESEKRTVTLSRPGVGDRIPGVVLGPGKPSTIVVHRDGVSGAQQDDRVKDLLQKGESLLLLDAFQTGSAVAGRNRTTAHFLTFNKTDDAERVQDILTAAAYLGTPRVRVLGLGDAKLWALFAGAVSGRIDVVDRTVGDLSDEELIQKFFVPGLQRAGGVRGALKLLGR